MELRELINSINDAFLRLESYMGAKRMAYNYYGFKKAFFKLFQEFQKDENYTQENGKLLSNYWKLTEQIRVDFDKGDFNNTNADDNKDFVKDCEEILELNWDHIDEFLVFPDPPPESKFSIQNVVDDLVIEIQNDNANPYPRIFLDEKSFRIFKKLHDHYLSNERRKNANYSFIFYAMKSDGLIVCGGTEFIRFLSELYQIEIDRVDSRQAGENHRHPTYHAIVENTL